MNNDILNKYNFDANKIIQDTLFYKPITFFDENKIFPVRVKDFSFFTENYAKYIVTNTNHLGIEKDSNLLANIITKFTLFNQMEKDNKLNNEVFQSSKIKEEAFPFEESTKKHKKNTQQNEKNIQIKEENIIEELNNFASMLEMIFQKKVKFKLNVLGFDILNEDGSYSFFGNNEFLLFREIVMIQNILQEPKQYHDKILEEWVNRAKKAREDKNVTFNDLIISVKNYNKISYKEIGEMNILQFYSDYRNYGHEKNFDASVLFKTVDGKSKIPSLIGAIIKELYDNSDDNLFINQSSIENKLK
ncbi:MULTISPECIES: hypothetical protein [unclassified Clostridium]|uniref:hypothetical protein n=1 Tax=unclassified Clostridium TaxID=2614128 RepID=UPI00207A7EB5|nr:MULTISPECIES: hypothetical protein [unclassified Clostridium]